MRIVAGRPFTQARILAGTTRLRAVLARNHTVYAALFEDHPLPIFVVDSATLDLVAVNEAARVTYGYSPEEFAVMSVLDLHPPEDRADVRAGWADPDEAAVRRRGVATHMAKDGRVFATEVVSTQLRLRGRQVRMTVVTDVTDRDNALADTEQCGLRYRQIVETAKEGVLTIDTDMAISSANQHAADLLGYPIDQLVGHPLAQFSGGDRRDSAQAQAVRQIEARQTGERETTLRRSNGTIVSVLMNQSPLLDKAGHYAGQLGMITDLTERNGLAHELAFRGVHDPLTGLPNRLLLVDRLELALGRATPGAGAVAVACVDVDAFKDVNTAHGHDGGDQILVEMAARLTGVVGLGDTVARFGGDEFVVICEGRGPFAERLAERISAVISTPYSVGESHIDITASVGVAVGLQGDRPATLLRSADIALLQAKADGGDRSQIFTTAMRASSKRRLALISDLRRAVERQEFSLRFQPVVSLVDQHIVGAEALVRWEHPGRGTLSPAEFISVAEETGLIDPIGQWVIEETCRHLAAWQRLQPRLDLSVSLNISARQLTRGSLIDTLRLAITESGVDPSGLVLEITEGVLMDDVQRSVSALGALRQTGVTIAIDDFGTGYSSLSYLQQFPIDTLKIDQSFVAGLPENDYDMALVRAVMAISGALNLFVIAEGVETEEQATALLQMGCQKAQGYHFYRPLTICAFTELLTNSLLVDRSQ